MYVYIYIYIQAKKLDLPVKKMETRLYPCRPQQLDTLYHITNIADLWLQRYSVP